jgi:hypothetical protein
MDIERSIKFPFEDEEWLQKLLIGAVVNVVPIVNLAAIGYSLQAAKNVIDGQDTPLPEWSDFGKQFVMGLLSFLGALIYFLPVILVSCVLGILTGAVSESGGGDGAAAIISICLGLFNFIYGILAGAVLPAALTRYVITDEFASMFRFGEIFAYIKDNLGNYVLAIIVAVILGTVASIIGSIACGIGVLFTSFWAMLAYAHLMGQVYVESENQAFAQVIE